jgi:hypothetical protein
VQAAVPVVRWLVAPATAMPSSGLPARAGSAGPAVGVASPSALASSAVVRLAVPSVGLSTAAEVHRSAECDASSAGATGEAEGSPDVSSTGGVSGSVGMGFAGEGSVDTASGATTAGGAMAGGATASGATTAGGATAGGATASGATTAGGATASGATTAGGATAGGATTGGATTAGGATAFGGATTSGGVSASCDGPAPAPSATGVGTAEASEDTDPTSSALVVPWARAVPSAATRRSHTPRTRALRRSTRRSHRRVHAHAGRKDRQGSPTTTSVIRAVAVSSRRHSRARLCCVEPRGDAHRCDASGRSTRGQLLVACPPFSRACASPRVSTQLPSNVRSARLPQAHRAAARRARQQDSGTIDYDGTIPVTDDLGGVEVEVEETTSRVRPYAARIAPVANCCRYQAYVRSRPSRSVISGRKPRP